MPASQIDDARATASRHDCIGGKEAGTLWGLFCERVRRSGDAIAYSEYDSVARAWRSQSWDETAARTDRFRTALARTGLKPGDRVAVLSPNAIDWVCFDMAAHSLGAVVVALYPHDSPGNNAYILGHSDARAALLDTPARWRSVVAHRGEFPALEHVWLREGEAGSDATATGPAISRLSEALARGGDRAPAIDVAPNALATLIYTSGTTGRPKGVMLSHNALLWNAEATAAVIPPRLDDVFLSVLPLAHAFERTLGYYLPMLGGSCVAYARSIRELAEDLVAVRPTILLGVPRLYEQAYGAVREQAESSAIKRLALRFIESYGWRRFEAERGEGPAPGIPARLLGRALESLAAGPIRAAFGGRLRVAVSGGAALDVGVARSLIGLGVPLVEGYGLTEAAPVVTAATAEESMPGSVGRPLPGVDLKLTEKNELLVRSPAVMMGYWKDEARTSRALAPDGWLSTGDIANIEDGRVFIRGRLSDMIALSTGEKIDPNVIEAEIGRDRLFQQVAVFGEGRPFLAALLVFDAAAWRRFAEDEGLDPSQPDADPARAKILARIRKALADLPLHAKVHAVHLSVEPWTIEAGLMTPTLKVKRDALQRRFAGALDELYSRRVG